jgi:hypothetical protein
MGCDHSRWTPPGQGKLDGLSPILAPLKPVKDQVTVITNTRLQNAYPGTHDTSNAGVSERGERQTHRELGLFLRHDSRPDRSQADGSRDASWPRSNSPWI